jgi:hypothetical protein
MKILDFRFRISDFHHGRQVRLTNSDFALQTQNKFLNPILIAIGTQIRNPKFFWFIVIGIFLASCGGGQQAPGVHTPTLAERIMKAGVPGINADSAYYFVERQVAFGPRVPNTQAHIECAEYLEKTLRRFVDEVHV